MARALGMGTLEKAGCSDLKTLLMVLSIHLLVG